MDDLARLRRDHPSWNFGSVWAGAASGPDARRLWASRNGVLLSAWTATELVRDINREERAASLRDPGAGPAELGRLLDLSPMAGGSTHLAG
jgi:hypothetical protein